MGLQTMRYRAALVGATLSILKVPSGGTRVECLLKQTDSAPESDDHGKNADQASTKAKGLPD
jgi:signal transduction histidine kinase